MPGTPGTGATWGCPRRRRPARRERRGAAADAAAAPIAHCSVVLQDWSLFFFPCLSFICSTCTITCKEQSRRLTAASSALISLTKSRGTWSPVRLHVASSMERHARKHAREITVATSIAEAWIRGAHHCRCPLRRCRPRPTCAGTPPSCVLRKSILSSLSSTCPVRQLWTRAASCWPRLRLPVCTRQVRGGLSVVSEGQARSNGQGGAERGSLLSWIPGRRC